MNRQEKQKLVLGKTIREIAKIVHISFGDYFYHKERDRRRSISKTELECQGLHKH